MAGSLTIDRSNLGLSDLVFGSDPDTGFCLLPGLSFGTVAWRKNVTESRNIAGRQMTDYIRDSSVVSGAVGIYGTSETDLQDKIAETIEAMTQVDPTAGFQTFTITFAHGAAVYACTATEPGDVTPGEDGAFDDSVMDDYFIQPLSFAIVRDPIPTQGPI